MRQPVLDTTQKKCNHKLSLQNVTTNKLEQNKLHSYILISLFPSWYGVPMYMKTIYLALMKVVILLSYLKW